MTAMPQQRKENGHVEAHTDREGYGIRNDETLKLPFVNPTLTAFTQKAGNVHVDAFAPYVCRRKTTMGNGAGVVGIIPPETRARALQATGVAIVQARHAAVLAHLHTVQLVRIARRYYAVVDERVLRRGQRIVEREVLHRVRRFADEVEVRSKTLLVKTISTTSVADAYEIPIIDVRVVQINKRDFEAYNCGPELHNVPTLHRMSRSLELTDRTVIEFLLTKCLWTPWTPPVAWRMKTDQAYDLTIHVACRHEGFLTGEIRIIRLRAGPKWVGPHHHDAMVYPMRVKWLHRTDYEITEKLHTAEGVFFQTIKGAWQTFLEELAREPKEDLEVPDPHGPNGFAYDEQEKRTSLRVKYLVETSIDAILKDQRTMFRTVHQYELWRMEQEDKSDHQTHTESGFAGALAEEHIDVLAEYYENEAMGAEDVKVLF